MTTSLASSLTLLLEDALTDSAIDAEKAALASTLYLKSKAVTPASVVVTLSWMSVCRANVGARVGWALGCWEGWALGWELGSPVGRESGCWEGWALGCDEGCRVG